ncbi:hypothetical protein GCM10010195_67310 [Kitasatospora griseola]|nr:hypothetical protein GCM10010195_67310 [Kitasatospora griseola]
MRAAARACWSVFCSTQFMRAWASRGQVLCAASALERCRWAASASQAAKARPAAGPISEMYEFTDSSRSAQVSISTVGRSGSSRTTGLLVLRVRPGSQVSRPSWTASSAADSSNSAA